MSPGELDVPRGLRAVPEGGAFDWRGVLYPRRVVHPRSGIRLVLVEPGRFAKGSPAEEAGRAWDERRREVDIVAPFYLGATEVTQAQWCAAFGAGRNPSRFSGDDHPVESVSHADTQAFLDWLDEWAAGVWRLPSEAEWEYACRAGSSEAFAWGSSLSASAANFDAGQTSAVDAFAPNAWGLYGMHGNVAEWCADWYRPYPSRLRPAHALVRTEFRVIRGGAWCFGAARSRSACRSNARPDYASDGVGLRVARALP